MSLATAKGPSSAWLLRPHWAGAVASTHAVNIQSSWVSSVCPVASLHDPGGGSGFTLYSGGILAAPDAQYPPGAQRHPPHSSVLRVPSPHILTSPGSPQMANNISVWLMSHHAEHLFLYP